MSSDSKYLQHPHPTPRNQSASAKLIGMIGLHSLLKLCDTPGTAILVNTHTKETVKTIRLGIADKDGLKAIRAGIGVK